MLLFFKAAQHLDVTTASASLYLVPFSACFWRLYGWASD